MGQSQVNRSDPPGESGNGLRSLARGSSQNGLRGSVTGVQTVKTGNPGNQQKGHDDAVRVEGACGTEEWVCYAEQSAHSYAGHLKHQSIAAVTVERQQAHVREQDWQVQQKG